VIHVWHSCNSLMIESAKSCWEHSGWKESNGITALPARIPQTALGHAAAILSTISKGSSSRNRRGWSNTGFPSLSAQRMRPNATSDKESAETTTNVTTRRALLSHIAGRKFNKSDLPVADAKKVGKANPALIVEVTPGQKKGLKEI
jgi:hypothetical protein